MPIPHANFCIPVWRGVAGKKRKDRYFLTSSQKLRPFKERVSKTQVFTGDYAVGIMRLFKITAQMENKDDK